jgi:hypothetical protein
MSENSGSEPHKERYKIMKRILLIVATVAGAFTIAASAQAGSPKGDEQAAAHKTVVMTTTTDQTAKPVGYQAVGDDGIAASPKFRQMLDERKAREMAVNAGQDVDYVHAPRPTLAPKDARFDAAWHANAIPEIQVAPLK